VRILVTDGPAAVRGILDAGAQFDVDSDGRLAFTREGGHSYPRIVHAGGDATGLEIQRTLENVIADRVTVFEHRGRARLVTDADGAAAAISVGTVDPSGRCRDAGLIARVRSCWPPADSDRFSPARQIPPYLPATASHCIAGRAEITDLEFVPVSPDRLLPGPGARGRQLLVSEAVRARARCWSIPGAA